MQLEQLAYESERVLATYKNSGFQQEHSNLEDLSSTVLYSLGSGPEPLGSGPKSLGSGPKPLDLGYSGFKPASDYGIGPGIARDSEGFIERYRAGKHEKFGEDHLNLEYMSPVTKKPLINLHIDMRDK